MTDTIVVYFLLIYVFCLAVILIFFVPDNSFEIDEETQGQNENQINCLTRTTGPINNAKTSAVTWTSNSEIESLRAQFGDDWWREQL